MMKDEGFDLKFDDRGLIPAIVQDADTGEVLMLAWMNTEALQRTIDTGEAHFWSRSRKELWHKGATSGNIQRVVHIGADCDRDTLLLRVHPAGPACHTGSRSCFFNEIPKALEGFERPQDFEGSIQFKDTLADGGSVSPENFSLARLYAVICDRRDHPDPGSYTSRLLSKGEDEIVKKIGEEAVEVILAAKSQGQERLVEEIADLTYHTLVLLSAYGLPPEAVLAELERRHKPRSTAESH